MKKRIPFILATGLALIGSQVVLADSITLLTEKDTASFTHTFTGADIHDSTGPGFQNGWSGGHPNMTLTTTGDILNVTTVGTTQTGILVGTGSTDGGTETWNTGIVGAVDDRFTIEMSLRVNNAPNGVRLWMGNDNERMFLDFYNDRLITTNTGTGLKTVPVDLTDRFHTIRLAYDGGPGNSDVHVWLDGTPVTDAAGGVFNSSNNDSRLLFGDSTSATDFDSFNVDVAALSYDTTGAFAPVTIPEPQNLLVFGLVLLAGLVRKQAAR